MVGPIVSDPDGLSVEMRQLISGDHDNPHRLLGRHEAEDGTVVRALRPSASAMRVLLPDGDRVEMAQEDPCGLFAAPVPQDGTGYRLEADYP